MLVALRSRRQIAPFILHRPTSLTEAMALRSASGSSAFLAGGLDLIDWLKHGNPIDRLIRLDGVPDLSNITGGHGLVRIGAMATHAAIGENALIRSMLPDLATLWRRVANPRVRFAGTIGGNVMADRSEYDALPALLALGTEAEIMTGEGIKRVALDSLPTLQQPLLTGLVIARPTALRLLADRTLRPAVALWIGITLKNERVWALRVAVGMAHPRPVCVTLPLGVDLPALGREAAGIAAEVVRQMPTPGSDGRGSASYRRRMIGVLTERLLIKAGASE